MRSANALRAVLVVCTLGILSGTSSAANPSVKVEYVAPIGPFNGLDYVYFEGAMTGTINRQDGSTGTYTVPVMAIYPVTGGNKTALVEWATSSNFYLFQDSNGNPVVCPRGQSTCTSGEVDGHRNQRYVIQYGRELTEDYIFKQGYTYFSVQPSKVVTDAMGPEPLDGTARRRMVFGTIQRETDGWEILKDAADFVRTAPTLTGLDVPAMRAMPTVIGFGYSATSMIVREFLALGLNVKADNSLVYDGFLGVFTGTLCGIFNDDSATNGMPPEYPAVCPGPAQIGNAKMIHIGSETDVELLGGYLARDANNSEPNLRTWELAGIAHLPASVYDLTYMGATHQNPVEFRPIVRAALSSLQKWIVDGTEPAPSVFINGTEAPDFSSFTPDVDADGNVTGGVRLPHMPSMYQGKPAGAPTGVYSGVDTSQLPFPPGNEDIALGGTYERFDDATLQKRYPDQATYQALVTAAADELLSQGYILKADRDLYAAGVPAQPGPPDNMMPSNNSGGGCNAAGSSSSGFCALLVFAAILFAYRRRSLLRILSFMGVGVALFLSGCGGGGSGSACTGHACANDPINLPQGGEVRIELATVKDGPKDLRIHSWFDSAQTPDSLPWPRPPANWKIQDGPDLCGYVGDMKEFPNGVPDSRTYIDAGPTVKFTATGAKTLTLNEAMNVQDYANDVYHDILYISDIDPSDVMLNTPYDFTVSGSKDFPAQTFSQALLVPPDYNVTYPDMTQQVILPNNQDWIIEWDKTSDDPYDYAFVTLSDLIGPLYFCIGPQSGYMTIPQSVISKLPQEGTIEQGLVNHRVQPYNGRRIDFIGINCKSTTFLRDPGD